MNVLQVHVIQTLPVRILLALTTVVVFLDFLVMESRVQVSTCLILKNVYQYTYLVRTMNKDCSGNGFWGDYFQSKS